MRPLLRPILLALAALLLVPALAAAQSIDPLGFRFSSPVYVAHAKDGQAVITVTRLDTAVPAQVRYITMPGTAIPSGDYRAVKNRLDFDAGQSSATFTVPVRDSGIGGIARTVNLWLFGPSPIGLAVPDHALLTIINDPVALLRNSLNPLGLAAAPPASDPLTGARPFVDHHWGLAWIYAHRLRHSHPRLASLISVIARQPEVHRFGNWTLDPQTDVGRFLARAAAEGPGTVPEMSTYYLNNTAAMPHCGGYSDPPWRVARYHRWTQRFAQGVGQYRAVLFWDMDSIITTGCLSRHGLAVRMGELRDALSILSKLPRLVIYLDAGAADGWPANRTASFLRGAGVSMVQGFFLNSTHDDWTSHEIRYGEAVSRMTGGKHFVVSTSVNGRGPLVPSSRVRYGNEILCNPPGRGLGPLPSFHTGFPNVDAFAWIGNPGKSGGTCNGGPPVGTFWPQYAAELVQNAVYQVH